MTTAAHGDPADRSLLVLAVDAQVIAFRRSDGTIAWRHTFQIDYRGRT
jgi:hypothetical protein